MTDKERFMKHVEIVDGHWIWIGARIANRGYGKIAAPGSTKNKRKIMTAHRFAYELFIGPIPPGALVLHKHEGVKLCVNPDHLYAGDVVDNSESFRINAMAGFLLLENLQARVLELEAGVQTPESIIRLDELKKLQDAPAPVWYDIVNLKESYPHRSVLKHGA